MSEKAENIVENLDNEAEISETVLEQAQQVVGINAAKIDELENQVASLKDALLRSAADLENTRKRAEKELQDVTKFAVSSFAKEMVNVLENIERALQATPEAERATALFAGLELTHKEVMAIFERRGIKQVSPQAGDKFDHNFHQAMAQVEDAQVEAGCVVATMQSGYVLHERLLRPAMVTVSKGAAGNEKHQLDTSA